MVPKELYFLVPKPLCSPSNTDSCLGHVTHFGPWCTNIHETSRSLIRSSILRLPSWNASMTRWDETTCDESHSSNHSWGTDYRNETILDHVAPWHLWTYPISHILPPLGKPRFPCWPAQKLLPLLPNSSIKNTFYLGLIGRLHYLHHWLLQWLKGKAYICFHFILRRQHD